MHLLENQSPGEKSQPHSHGLIKQARKRKQTNKKHLAGGEMQDKVQQGAPTSGSVTSLHYQQNSLLELSLAFFPHSVISSVPRLHTRLLGALGCSTSPPLPTIT